MMKSKFFLFLALSIALFSCKKGLEINVDIADTPEQEVNIMRFYNDSLILLEEKKIKSGKFTFKVEPDYPSLLRIRFGLGKYIFISVDEGDQDIRVTGNWSNFDQLKFEGSASTVDLEKFFHNMRVFATSQTAYLTVEEQLRDDPSKDSLYKDVQEKSKTSRADFEHSVEDYVNQSPYLLNKLFVLNFLNKQVQQRFIDSTLSELLLEYPDNPELLYSVQTLSPGLAEINKAGASRATEISGLSPEGKEVKLSDFRGKYVLVDFWASWCPPCRAENPSVVKLYQKYKGQNFTILGVSLDKEKEPWVKAIKSDKLDWNHTSELKGWQALSVRDYDVTSIPANVLIDTAGNILGRNLSTNELDTKLASIFQK